MKEPPRLLCTNSSVFSVRIFNIDSIEATANRVKFAKAAPFSYDTDIDRTGKSAYDMKELIEKVTSLREKIFRTWGYL